jgi:tagatose 1,6-diphosphate aldolase
MKEITKGPGVWLGLKRTSSNQHVFTVVAFDQRGSYAKMLPVGSTYDNAVAIKEDVVDALSPYASAILLDPDYGLSPAQRLHRGCGLLMALEETGYSGDSTYRHTEMYPDWSVAQIKRMGASAVKVLVYYNPYAGELAEEIEALSRKVSQQCKEHDIAYFLEPVTYSIDAEIAKNSAEFARMRPEMICETTRRLGTTGADVLKVEFPVDVNFDDDQTNWLKACEAVSAASPVPWALLSAGVDFPVFEQQVEVACKGGASGFLGGRAIWKESVSMSSSDRQRFLADVGVKRIQKLSEITNRFARPWTDFYQATPAKEYWFADYR